MKKQVTMFVWNEFQNDARVLRECTALVEDGYSVTLLALGGKTTTIEKRTDLFTVRRLGFQLLTTQKKWLREPLLLISIAIIYYSPLLAIALLVSYIILYKTKMKHKIHQLILILKMIFWGLKEEATIYHANDLNTLLQAVICGKWLKKRKVIFDSHEINISRTGYDSWIYPLLEQFLLRYTDECIHENNTRARFIEKVYHFSPHVIYNYPFYQTAIQNKINLHEQLGLAATEPILLYQGGLQEGRGLDKLLDAVPHIKKGTVVFLGEGKFKPQLQAMTEQKELTNRVKFLPKVPMEDLPSYTCNAYIGFQLLNDTCFNHYSAASNKLFEYVMAGIPVVACEFPEIKKVVKNDEIGIIVKSDDPISIAQGVNFLVDNPEMHEKMHQNTLKAREKYNWTNEKKKFLKIYQKLAER
ncbi:glycosyltransferase family 4 protein [Listeria booriae]|uniref:Glycosyltransferase family 4 protein n=1 Tax=Listeria booriae TaxID=1552123 RepID=A0A841YRH3_9LIST|nr:glycosyltransferase [Listeria booriae]MBC1402534.1 glycosyltransferase family 4 protein [Listeria booriae]MBC1616778.1 glycosyltransferase family 4 protein [Listeria booriae]